MTGKSMRSHIVEEAHTHGLAILMAHAINEEKSYADTDDMIVVVPMVEDERTYAVALHELGHLCNPDGHSEEHPTNGKPQTAANRRILLAQESAAWDWAEEHAIKWTPTMQAAKDHAISTYEEGIRMAEEAERTPARCINCGKDAANEADLICRNCRDTWPGDPKVLALMESAFRAIKQMANVQLFGELE